MRAQYFSALLVSGLAAACPTPRQASTTTVAAPAATATAGAGAGTGSGSGSGSSVDMAAAIKAIMPTSNSCSGAQFPDECRTAEQAAPFISKACADLSTAECAATISIMGLESVDMKFKHNVSPGRPGQGTANMMMANFVSEYATDLFGADKVAGKTPDEVLALVTPDETNFGSAAWFLTKKCSADVRSSLKTGTDAGWIAYNQCIGVDGTLSDRMAYWTRAKQAFNL
ncbi:hypothetical protein C8A03DRAFT_36354 [Achaetomium macrosporum]|uniref:Lysozyme-like protein n=1 Tax=Achaetomium macrosporum TaxID=79813 RepID=A0AAN7C6R5_9PEZI|nr:hypothetical protein C8A03DRAFT_36354 [Achaetomium macrosporum]